MSAEQNKAIRLNKVAKELNVGIHTIVEYLAKKGKKIDPSPNTKIDSDVYDLLSKAFLSEKKQKEASKTSKKKEKLVEIVLDATEVVKKEKEEREEVEIPNEIVIRDVTLGNEIEKAKEEVKPQQKPADKEEVEVKEEVVEVKEVEVEPVAKIETENESDSEIETEIEVETEPTTIGGLNILGKIDLKSLNQKTKPTKKKKDRHYLSFFI